MASLYQLTDEYLTLLDMAEEGDIPEEVFSDTLEGLSGEIGAKLDGYGKVLKELEMISTGLKSEIDRLSDRRKSIENNMDRMKAAMQNAMTAIGQTKIKTELFTFGIQKNPPSVSIIDPHRIETKYFLPQEPKIDKAAILRDLKAGKECDWAEIKQGESLRIR